MLQLKFLSGVFEDPYADAKYAETITDNAEARALAAEAARKSVVLLKNDGTLPLRAASLKTLAVIGPNAAVAQMGGYSNVPRRAISVLDGFARCSVALCASSPPKACASRTRGTGSEDEVVLANPAENRSASRKRVAVDSTADAIVLVIGGSAATSREAWADNHPGDATTLELVGEQNELARALLLSTEAVVTVLINGRPQAVVEVAEKMERTHRRLVSRPGRRNRNGRHSVRRRESGRQTTSDVRSVVRYR